jgi:hypothetical protein
MKVNPEDLKIANRVAGIKETSGSAVKKNYWNGVHRLHTEGNKLVLDTTDNVLWITWNIPVEGEAIPLDVLLPERSFDYAARYLDGGSFTVSYENRVVQLSKDQLKYPLKQETQQPFPRVTIGEPGEQLTTWEASSKELAKALKFVAPFIDDTNPSPHKSVATLFATGIVKGGHTKRISVVEGLDIKADMSFKASKAKAVAEFLNNISETVIITVASNAYKFEDKDNGHVMIVLAESGRFPIENRDIRPDLRETVIVDRKMLLQRAKVFQGVMAMGSDRLNIALKGEDEFASLRVYTPGDTELEVAADEFGVVRTVHQPVIRTSDGIGYEKDEDGNAKEAPKPPEWVAPVTEKAINRELLAEALENMEGTNVNVYIYGRFLIINDEVTETGIKRSILLNAQSIAQAAEEEKKAKEAAEKAAKEKEAAEKAKPVKAEKAAAPAAAETPVAEAPVAVEATAKVPANAV